MKYQIDLNIKDQTYRELQEITQKLNQGERQDLAKKLGAVFTEMSCQVLDQLFGTLVEEQRLKGHLNQDSANNLKEAEQILGQIEGALKKYMPWSISFFSNERLKPVANHILNKFNTSNPDQIKMFYILDRSLGEEANGDIEALLGGDLHALPQTLKNLVKIIDLGVSEFIRDPKTLLKFNFVVDKTLNGVINMITSTGYKRIEKIGQDYNATDIEKLQYYAQHFRKFLVAA